MEVEKAFEARFRRLEKSIELDLKKKIETFLKIAISQARPHSLLRIVKKNIWAFGVIRDFSETNLQVIKIKEQICFFTIESMTCPTFSYGCKVLSVLYLIIRQLPLNHQFCHPSFPTHTLYSDAVLHQEKEYRQMEE